MPEATTPTSRNIPWPIQREVRRRCAFGCVVCGLPLYEYDHMLGWANVHEHVADDITLLCDQHHRERTGGLLPLDRVRDADANPFNRRTGVSKSYDLHFSGPTCEAVIGSNKFFFDCVGATSPIVSIPIGVDRIALLAFVFDEGHVLINLLLFDEANVPILQIVNNQLVYSVSPWDIQLVGRNLIVRDAPRKILVDITFDVPNRIVMNRGRFLCNGVEILVTPQYFLVVNNRMLMSECEIGSRTGGIIIGAAEMVRPAAFRIPHVDRYLGDREAAKKWADEAFGSA